MRNLILLLIGVFLIPSTAFSRDSRCYRADTHVNIQASNYGVSKSIIIAKEGDRICLNFETLDTPKTFSIQGLPVYLKSYRPGEVSSKYFRVRKKGEYKVRCNFCGEQPIKLVVFTEEEFYKRLEWIEKRRAWRDRIIDQYDSPYRRRPSY